MIIIEIENSTINNVRELDKELIVVGYIEDVFTKYSLTITQITTLATKKGTIHWHLKNGTQKGILEVTYWIPANRLWLEIHRNRRTGWNERIIFEMANEFVAIFGGEIVEKNRIV